MEMQAEAQLTREQVVDRLRAVQDPELARDVVTLGLIRDVDIEGGRVYVDVVLTTPNCPFASVIVERVRSAVAGMPGVERVEVTLGGCDCP
jgi:ATP-binding protein involved in chromosome partitioning